MLFDERNDPGGVYATCFRNFTRDADSLSQLEYYADFIGETNLWPLVQNRFVSRFFRPSEPDNDLVVTLFGEVLDEREGTGLGARGGSALKRTQSETTDASRIRDVLALGAPTGADQELNDLFLDQIVTLGQVAKFLPLPGSGEAGVFLSSLALANLLAWDIIKRLQWIKYKNCTTEPSILSVNLPYKYTHPTKPAAHTKLQKRASDMDVSDSKSANISLKSTYEPDMMPDFNPSLNLGGARLVQQALFDENADLVPPWEAPSVFRKGALVAVEAQLSVYHFVEDKKPSHLYQMKASRVILLARSPLEHEDTPAPSAPRKKPSASRSAMFDKMLNIK